MEAAPNANVRRPGFFRALWKAMRELFHEATGTLFFLLALSWVSSTIRLWQRRSTPWLIAACGSFIVLLIFFGVTSFRAARRVR